MEMRNWDTERLMNLPKATQRKRSNTGIWTQLVWSRRRQWQPTPVLLCGKSHGLRSLVDCSPWGHWESDTSERLHFHFSLSCIGEGNGNPLQYSCLENPRDGGPWWAAVYGVTQSRTRLKLLSSSGSSMIPVEKEMATHSSIVAWKIPWTEEPGRLQSMELHKIGCDWATEYGHVQ